MPFFKDRADAGRQLSELVGSFARRRELVTLALFSGGIPIAVEIAKRLGLPLDVLVAQELTVDRPNPRPFGVVSPRVEVINHTIADRYRLTETDIAERVAAARRAVASLRRELDYPRPLSRLAGRTVLFIDDGLSSRAHLESALVAVRATKPGRLILLLPTVEPGTADLIYPLVDDLICVVAPQSTFALDRWYADSGGVTIDDARRLLHGSAA